MNPKKVWRKIFGKYEVGDLVLLKRKFAISDSKLVRIRSISIGWDPVIYCVETLDESWLGWVPPEAFEFVG